jgi:S1-C subfamily serine protease
MAHGVVVLSPGDSIAAQQGFQSGDIVHAINGSEIHSVADLNRALANAGGQWDMIIDRGGQQIHVSLGG